MPNHLELENTFYESLDNLLLYDEGKPIAIAVSGGVDSVSLMVLAVKYMNKLLSKLAYNEEALGSMITVIHVDHDLRPESATEAEYVRDLAVKMGVRAVCLKWEHGYSDKDVKIPNLQEKARLARYGMMMKKCKELGIEILLTGHHFDDVMENYVYRKARSAGILGLSTNKVSYHKDLRILRPLQVFRKIQLEKYLKEKDIKWYHDKSNDSTKYERNKIRKKLESCSEYEIENLTHEIELNNQKADKLNDEYITCISESCSISELGIAKLNLQKFCSYAQDLQIYLLSYLLTIISGQSKMPRARVVEPAIESIMQNGGEKFSRTLHNCQLFIKGEYLVIHKEISKISDQKVCFFNEFIWDDRFEFILKGELESYYIEPLTPKDIKLLKSKESEKISQRTMEFIDDLQHRNILFTLPAIKTLEKLVAIPHIFFYDNSDLKNKLTIVFRPNFISRFTHYLG